LSKEKEKEKGMTIINEDLLKCPKCSKSSVALTTVSYSTFTVKDIKDVMQLWVIKCPHCDYISWKENLEYVGLLDDKFGEELTNLHSFLQHNKKYKDKYELAQKNADDELFNSVIDAHREKHAARKKEINEKYDWWEDIDLNDCNSILKDKILNGENLNDKQVAYLHEWLEDFYKKEKMSIIYDKAKGCLVGLVAGDDNGGPTAMMTQVLNSFLGEPVVDIEGIDRLYLQWFKEDGYDAGLVTHKVLELVDSGLSFDEAALQVHKDLDGMTAGISPAHRSIPLAIIFAKHHLRTPVLWGRHSSAGIRWLTDAVDQEAKLTHLHNDASEVSQAVNAICMYLILGHPLEKSLRFGSYFIKNNLNNRFQRVRYHSSDEIKSLSIGDLSDGGYAPDVLIAAIWFLLNTDTFEEALKQSKEFAGVANYCPVLVGSIGGALYGYNSIKSNLNQRTIESTSSISIVVDHALTV